MSLSYIMLIYGRVFTLETDVFLREFSNLTQVFQNWRKFC